MQRFALVIAIAGCSNGDGTKSAREPAAGSPPGTAEGGRAAESTATTPSPPPPKPDDKKKRDQVAISSDPCDGGEVASDPCDGGEVTRATVGGVTGAAGKPEDSIAATFRRHITKLRPCYQDYVGSHPKEEVKSSFELELTIAADGKVTAASVTQAPPELASCLVKAVKTIAFPSTGRDSKVRVPLRLIGN
jgi:hypothetical protein